MRKRNSSVTMATVPGAQLLCPGPSTYLSLLFVASAVILWEVILTRIFSVILYYHYAFMAVSVAMFGLTLGAVIVFIREPIPSNLLERKLGELALWQTVLILLAISIQLSIPFQFANRAAPAGYLVQTYMLAALPFIPAGMFICLALTRFEKVGGLYAADLVGAGIGCALVPGLLIAFGGPGAIVMTAVVACLAAAILLRSARPAWAWAALLFSVGLTGFAFSNREGNWLRIRWRHTGAEPKVLHESWNAFSRITVRSLPQKGPSGWGIDPVILRGLKPVEELFLEIDSGAGTPLTRFDGNLDRLDHLRYDVTAFAHRLRQPADVLVIGAGGGRDILTALAFQQRSVRAIEVNPNTVRAVNDIFGDFTGHLDRLPQVTFVTDEGRSYLATTKDRFDIIQASFIDTVAATAAGAYTFVENGLYTVEAWRLFLSRLRPKGVLTFSRFYYGSTTVPVEIYRTVALAIAALKSFGAADPASHILLITNRNPQLREVVATILLSPSPFSRDDIAKARDECVKLRCEVALSKEGSEESIFDEMLGRAPIIRLSQFPFDISPPLDDRPFFFFQVRVLDVLRGTKWRAFGGSAFNLPAVQILVTLTAIATLLGLALILLPRIWLGIAGRWPKPSSFSLAPFYFAAIGLAFMFVEIGFIQRFSLFLGHPTYGFTVVLLGLLTLGGLGSLMADFLRKRLKSSRHWMMLGILPLGLLIAEVVGSYLLPVGSGTGAPSRILLSLSLIIIPGLLMGLPFPMGMAAVHSASDQRAPWYWAINGACSVIASVLAMVCSLTFGIRMTIMVGAGLYGLATSLFWISGCASEQPSTPNT